METDKEYLTLDEAAQYMKIKRMTIYHYLKDLNIKTRKFGRDKRAYLSRAEVELLKKYKDEPWNVEIKEKKEDAA